MRYLFIAGFVVMVAAQWYVPVSMILETNATIDEGVEYWFRTRPIDPADPFRGRYITLNFEAEMYNPADTNETHFDSYSPAYATLGTDSAGFAKIVNLSAVPPKVEAGKHGYIPVQVQYASVYDGRGSVQLDFPFDKFYLEESKASEAEQLYWSTRRDSGTVCYAKVRVKDGKAILTDVMINDSSVVDIVRRINAGKTN